MLEILGKLSKKLQPLRKLSYVLIAILVAGVATYLVQSGSNHQLSNSYAILDFVVCIWLLLLNLLLSIFNDIPKLDMQGPKFKRLKVKIQRFLYQLFAVLFMGLTFVVIFLTIRLLRV